MKLGLALAILCHSSTVVTKPNSFFSTKSYLQSRAPQKMDHLWDEIWRDETAANYPSYATLFTFFGVSMTPVFDQPGDAMEPGWFFDRIKYFHAVGVTGMVQFIPDKNDYTGLFQTGADWGLIRFSSAAQPYKADTPENSIPLVPGFGLKFLRDGTDSANLMALYSSNGQPGEWDFFAHDFETHFPEFPPTDSTIAKAFLNRIASGSDNLGQIGLSDWGQLDQYGTTNYNPQSPWKLTFKPHADVIGKIPNEYVSDMAFLDQLPEIKSDSNLYDVYAWNAPEEMGGVEAKIGTLKMRGALYTSKWADEKLFFRHQRMTDDFKQYKDWNWFSPRYSLGGKCPYQVYPNNWN